MQIFELHFNPKLKEGEIFDSFVYEPESVGEKALGSLYLVGELKNALPQNLKFLDNLAAALKKNYYTPSIKSPEKALSQCLKKTNQFLSDEVKKENVSWLGNLNFAVLSLKELELNFSKTGQIKILLLRKGQITDIAKNLELEEIDPYPLKIFFNVVSGKLTQNDIILVLTRKAFDFLKEKNILLKLAGQAEKLTAKKIKEILPPALFIQREGKNVSGICLAVVIKPEIKGPKRNRPILFQEQKEKKSSLKLKLPKISFLKLLKLPKPKLKLPRLTIPKIQSSALIEKFRPQRKSKKKIILLIVLASVLILGFLLFKKAGEIKEESFKKSLSAIEEKINQAESFLIIKEDKKANSLLQQAWQEISLLEEKENSEAIELKKEIEEKLNKLNKLEIIAEPEQVNELEYKNIFFSSNSPDNLGPAPKSDFSFDFFAIYLFNIYFLDQKTCEIIKYPYLGTQDWGASQIWKEKDNYCSNPKAMAVDGSVWIVNQDNSILRYYTGSWQETLILNIFPLIENIVKIKTGPYLPYLYLLEPVKNRLIVIDKQGKIVKQFQSPKFDNLEDFAFSQNGETIYLKNGSTIYKVEL